MNKIDKEFYQRSAKEVGMDLLGLILVHESEDGVVKGKIVEVEAYMGKEDKAAHSYKDNQKGRTRIQYGEGGYAYIYLIYGMHYCMNVVANQKDIPESILIRGIEPIEGIDIMIKRRRTNNVKNLCNGPGKLCAAFGITKSNYGMDLCGNTLYIEKPEVDDKFEIQSSKRINIDYAEEASDFLYRYTIKDNKYVSKIVK